MKPAGDRPPIELDTRLVADFLFAAMETRFPDFKWPLEFLASYLIALKVLF